MNILYLKNYRLVETKEGDIDLTQIEDFSTIEKDEREKLIEFLKG